MNEEPAFQLDCNFNEENANRDMFERSFLRRRSSHFPEHTFTGFAYFESRQWCSCGNKGHGHKQTGSPTADVISCSADHHDVQLRSSLLLRTNLWLCPQYFLHRPASDIELHQNDILHDSVLILTAQYWCTPVDCK